MSPELALQHCLGVTDERWPRAHSLGQPSHDAKWHQAPLLAPSMIKDRLTQRIITVCSSHGCYGSAYKVSKASLGQVFDIAYGNIDHSHCTCRTQARSRMCYQPTSLRDLSQQNLRTRHVFV
jgi:hypothetical protein